MWWVTGDHLLRLTVVQWARDGAAGRSQVRFPMVPLEFFIDIILPAALGLAQTLREMSARNIFCGVKAADS